MERLVKRGLKTTACTKVVWILEACQPPHARGLVASLWCYGKVVEPLGCGPGGRMLGHWVGLEGNSGLFLLSLLLPGYHKVNGLSHRMLPVVFCFTTGPKTTGPWAEVSENMHQSESFFLLR